MGRGELTSLFFSKVVKYLKLGETYLLTWKIRRVYRGNSSLRNQSNAFYRIEDQSQNDREGMQCYKTFSFQKRDEQLLH